MPYDLKKPPKDKVKAIKSRHPAATTKDVRQWIHIFNGCMKEDSSDEGKCHAMAWGVLKKKLGETVVASTQAKIVSDLVGLAKERGYICSERKMGKDIVLDLRSTKAPLKGVQQRGGGGFKSQGGQLVIVVEEDGSWYKMGDRPQQGDPKNIVIKKLGHLANKLDTLGEVALASAIDLLAEKFNA